MAKRVVTKAEVRGTASGVMFMAFFGTLWADIGIGGLQVSGAIWLLILSILIGGGLFFSGIIMMRSSRHLPQKKDGNIKRINKWFNIIFVAEFGLIIIAAMITNIMGHFEWFFPIMAIIVGVHFFPLAYLFQVKTYYATGALLCIIAIVTLLFIPLEVSVGNHQINAWWTLIGLGSMLTLWITSLVMLFMGRTLLSVAKH